MASSPRAAWARASCVAVMRRRRLTSFQIMPPTRATSPPRYWPAAEGARKAKGKRWHALPEATSQEVTALGRNVERIEQFQKATNGALWCRGVGNSDYFLEPTLYRMPGTRAAVAMASLKSGIAPGQGSSGMPNQPTARLER